MSGDKWTSEKVLMIKRWTPALLSFRITRDRDFDFVPGQYARLGLGSEGESVWRPFSMASGAGDDYLEFVAVLVSGGAFSEQLEKLCVEDTVKVDKASYGFLTVGQLAAGRELWLIASGTGIGPFMSILRDRTTWTAFERLMVLHSVRHSRELVYGDELAALSKVAPVPDTAATLGYFPVVTREPGASALADRIPRLLADGRLEKAVGATLSVIDSRLMVCGNPHMAKELRQMLSTKGFATNRRGVPGQMAFEKYW